MIHYDLLFLFKTKPIIIASKLVNINEIHKPILEINPVLVVFLSDEGLITDVFLFTVNSVEASPVSETIPIVCFPDFNVETKSLLV